MSVLSIKLGMTYKVQQHTIRLHRWLTPDGVALVVVRLNKSSFAVREDDVRKRGLMASISNKRRYCKTLSTHQYTLMGSTLHYLSKLQQSL